MSEQVNVYFDRRQAITDALLPAFMGSESAERYFSNVVLPNLLPEIYPEKTVDNIYWIGRRAAASFAGSAEAFGNLLQYLVEQDELSMLDAQDCAEALNIDWRIQCQIKEGFQYADDEAKVYFLHVKKVQTETRNQFAQLRASAISGARPALRLV